MKMHSSARIFGRKYKIRQYRINESGVNDDYGSIQYSNRQILLNTERADATRTLAHELVHGYANALHYSPEEDVIEQIATALLSCCAENPEIMREFIKEMVK